MKTLIFFQILWLSTSVFASKPNFIVYDSSNTSMEVNNVNDIIIDGHNKLWFSISGWKDSTFISNLLSYDGKTFDNLAVYNVFPWMTSFTIDSSYNPWLTYTDTKKNVDGITKKEDNKWKKLDTNDKSYFFRGLKTDCNGNVIVGTLQSIFVFDKDLNIIQQFFPPKKHTKYQSLTLNSFFIENCEDLWFGFGQSGIYHHKISSKGIGNQIEWFNSTNSILNYFSVGGFTRDAQNNLWFNGFDLDVNKYYLIKYDNEKFIIADSVLQSGVIGFDKQGLMYVTTADSGLYRVDVLSNIWTSFNTIEPDFPKCNVHRMAIDKDNNFWFGTDIGLIRYNETGIDNIHDQQTYETNSSIFISPNPSSDFIEITKPSEGWEPSEGSANSVRIFDVFGELVSTSVCSADTSAGGGQKIDVSGLPSGVYFVRIGDKVSKFIKI